MTVEKVLSFVGSSACQSEEMPYIARSKTAVPASNAKNKVVKESLMISKIIYDERAMRSRVEAKWNRRGRG